MAGTVTIVVNGAPEEVEAGSTLAALIERFNEKDPSLIVELNGRCVFPRRYATATVAAGDRVEFINPNFGG